MTRSLMGGCSMADLSPVAQAVLTAQAKERCLFEWSALNDPPCHPSDSGWNGCVQCVDRRGLAAALRAVADQLPLQPLTRKPADPFEEGLRQGQELSRVELLAIADELETQ